MIEITDARVNKIDNQGTLKGSASITIDNAFVIHDIKIIDGKNGMFISMPSRRNKAGEYKDIAHPINQETRSIITKAILDKYNEL
jgi:stage V sporulation protein G